MKSYVSIFILFCLLCRAEKKENPRVLVFSKTKGYRHESIGVGKLALIDLERRTDSMLIQQKMRIFLMRKISNVTGPLFF